jgi:hypothetical protein
MIGEAPVFGLEDGFLKVVLKKDLRKIFDLYLVKGNRKFHKLFTCAT